MKAEEPGDRVPIVKFGMGASEQHKIVERHFAEAQERQAIAEYHFAHALVVAPVLRAAFDRIGKRSPEEQPVVIAAAPEAASPDELRKSLGLG